MMNMHIQNLPTAITTPTDSHLLCCTNSAA